MEIAMDYGGFDDTMQTLAAVGPKFRDHVIGRAVRAGSRHMQKAVRRNIPGNLASLKPSVIIKKLKGRGFAATELVGARYGADLQDNTGPLLQLFEYGTGAHREIAASLAAFGKSSARGEAYPVATLREQADGPKFRDFGPGGGAEVLKIPGDGPLFQQRVMVDGVRPVGMFRKAAREDLDKAQKVIADEVVRLGQKELDALGNANLSKARARRAGL